MGEAFKTACTHTDVRQAVPLIMDRGRNSCYLSLIAASEACQDARGARPEVWRNLAPR
jgi:hypothetical protein